MRSISREPIKRLNRHSNTYHQQSYETSFLKNALRSSHHAHALTPLERIYLSRGVSVYIVNCGFVKIVVVMLS